MEVDGRLLPEEAESLVRDAAHEDVGVVKLHFRQPHGWK
jgi:hypothetical protein